MAHWSVIGSSTPGQGTGCNIEQWIPINIVMLYFKGFHIISKGSLFTKVAFEWNKKKQKNGNSILGFFSTLISLRLRETLQVTSLTIDYNWCWLLAFDVSLSLGGKHNFRFWSNLFSMQRLSPTKEFYSFAKISLEIFMSQLSSS